MSERQTHRAVCETCEIQSERRSEQFIRDLVELHNESRDGCDAEAVPLCWVCFDPATHRNQTPPYEYACETHAISIDFEPLSDDCSQSGGADDG